MEIKEHDNTVEEILSKFTYGMYVVSSGNAGCLIDTACQITSAKDDYCIITVALNKENETTKEILKRGKVSLTVLAKDVSFDLISKFGYKSSRDIDKFTNVYYNEIDGNKILIDQSIGWLYGEVVDKIEFNSHIIFAVKVEDSYITDKNKEPFTYNDYKEMIKSA